eukprot:scaffold11290_cov125-Isochrysis_galbana.AAC.5
MGCAALGAVGTWRLDLPCSPLSRGPTESGGCDWCAKLMWGSGRRASTILLYFTIREFHVLNFKKMLKRKGCGEYFKAPGGTRPDRARA